MEEQNTDYLKGELYSLIKTKNKVLDFLQDGSLDGIWFWNLEEAGKEWMAPVYWKTFVQSPEKLAHETAAWQALMATDSFRLITENAKKERSDFSKPFDHVVKYKHENGSTVWVRCRMVIITDNAGKPTRMLGTHTDITTQKRKEISLEKTNERLKDIISSTGDLVFVIDCDLVVKEMIKGHDHVDKNLYHWFKGIKSLKDTNNQRLIDTALQVLNSKERGSVEISLKVNGNIIWYEIIISSIRGENESGGLICVCRDITEKKRVLEELVFTKELLQTTSEVSNVGGWTVDLINETIYWSDITQKIHEVPQGYVPSFETAIEFYKEGNSKKTIQNILKKAIELGEGWDTEVELVTAKGKDRWVRTRGKPEVKNGKCIKLYGTFEDVTNKKRGERRLEKALTTAKEAAVAKSNFLSNMSHEIRTPLNAVIGMTHLLLGADPRADQMEKLKTLKFSANNLLSIVNDILDYSKIEEGKITFEKISFDLHDTVNSLKHALSFKAKENSTLLKVRFDSDIPKVVNGDPTRLVQILNNLLGNAIKFTKNGKVSLCLELEEESDEKVRVLFEVIDTGIGMSEDQIEKVFERFTQASSGTTRNFGGTGLGLSIVKRLLELQESKINIESEKGKGSTFSFVLELGKVQENTQEQSVPDIRKNRLHELDGMRILLAEDNMVNQMVATEFLNNWNVELDYAANGVEAVEKVMDNDYDVILMDIQMPEMDGYEATLRIKALGGEKAKIPILAMTASTMVNMKDKMPDIGFEDHVLKPFEPKELNDKLVKYGNKKSLGSKVDFKEIKSKKVAP